jgi:hypothetical protein
MTCQNKIFKKKKNPKQINNEKEIEAVIKSLQRKTQDQTESLLNSIRSLKKN